MNFIQSAFRAIDQFFFTPSQSKSLSFFRIFIGLFCAVQIIGIYPDLLNIYGAKGFIRTEISQILIPDYLPKVSWFSNWVATFGVSEASSVYLLAHVTILVSLCLAAGLATRLMAILCWFIHLMFYGTGSVFSYGADGFLAICLFYCIIMPVGYYWSLDNVLLRKKRGPSIGIAASVRILQLHLGVAYFMGGLCKSFGTQWWNGEAIWRAVMLPQFSQFDMGWLASFPHISMILGWGVLMLECLYLFFMLYRKSRLIGLVFIILMHIGIALFMGLYYFSAIMIIMNIAAFGGEYLDRGIAFFVKIKKQALNPQTA